MGEIIKFKGEIIAKVFESENWKIYGGMPALESKDIKFHMNKYGNLTLVGNLPSLEEYKVYDIEAEHINDPKFGHQYKVLNISRDIPKTGEEIKTFLSEILTEEQAHEVYTHYPNIIDLVKDGKEDEIDTSKMYNIGSYRIDVIVKKIQENYVLMELINEFSPFGLNMSGVKQLYSKYKNADKVREVFNNDPYDMIINLSGFAFKKADKLILKKRPELVNSYVRCKAYVDKLMIDNELQGNTIIKIKDIMDGLNKDVPETKDHFTEAIKAPEFKVLGELMVREKTYMSEKYIADTIIKMQYFEEIEEWEYDFSKVNEGKEFPLTDEQIGAIKMVLNNNVSMLFAGGGCVDADTEYFNGTEWVRIADYKEGDKVLQFNEDRTANLVHPEQYHKYECEEMTFINNHTNSVNQVLSDEHDFVYDTGKGVLKKIKVKDLVVRQNTNKQGFNGRILNSFSYSGSGINLTDAEIKLRLAVFADGHYIANSANRCVIRVKKQRKKDELERVFSEVNIDYVKKEVQPSGYHGYYFYPDFTEKIFESYWYDCNENQLNVIAENILKWDGSIDLKKRRRWSTTIKSDADFVQFVFSSLGYPTTINTKDRVGEEYFTCGKTYTRKSVEYEIHISKRKNRTTSIANDSRNTNIKTKIEKYKTKDGYKYCFTTQSGMLVLRRDDRIFITGNSGKSFSMKTLLEILDYIGKSSIWLAPTGKAGKTLENYISRGASTIHRGLDYNPMYISETGSPWGYNEDNKLPYDIVIVDESSMIDVDLMESLLKAIDIKHTKLFLVGDAHQIPSVAKGNVVYDLLESNLIPNTTLTKIFRYKEGGMAKALKDMRDGKKFYDDLKFGLNVFGETKDYILYRVTQEKSTGAILKIYDSLIKKKVDIKDIVIIMAQNVHEHGTININKIIQSYLLKNTNHLEKNRFVEANGQKWYIGDVVLQTKNNYRVEKYNPNKGFLSDDIDYKKGKPTVSVFNGDSGKIVGIDGNTVIIDFDGIKCEYTKDMFGQLLLGYAISIYKMQGSQSPYVILSTPKAHTFQMNKNLLYTGASRTQKKLFHVTNESIISSALRKSATFKRNTLLRPLLVKAKQEIDDVPS